LFDYTKKSYEGVYALSANERVLEFIAIVENTLKDGLRCSIYSKMETGILLFMIHAYYPLEECRNFFSSILSPDIKFSEFIKTNYPKYRTVTELANVACMTTQQFSKRFKKVFNASPNKWIQREKAQSIYYDICQSNKPLKEIAMDNDFSMMSNFIRFCRMNFGESPGEMRKKHMR
jgi:AraC-like DNA-binding protein